MSDGLTGLLAQGGGWPAVVIIAALLIGLVLRTRSQAELRRRIERLEEQALHGSSVHRRDPSVSRPVAPRTSSASPTTPDSLTADVLQQVRAGRKIEAIKLYRQATGLGLKEAKDAVEAIERAARPR